MSRQASQQFRRANIIQTEWTNVRMIRYNATGSVITRHLNFSSVFARANDTLNSHEGVIARRPVIAFSNWKRIYILIRFIPMCIILETVMAIRLPYGKAIARQKQISRILAIIDEISNDPSNY